MSDLVRDQYEAYPYPTRIPSEESERLILGTPSNLHEVNHYLHGGRLYPKIVARGKPFRALIAGGGTGDAAIMLAQQWADAVGAGLVPPAEFVYLDLSEASLAVAKARAEARGLTSIQFHRASLFDLPGLGLKDFDYIDCCGVLHHLEEPAAGLRALRDALAPGGGMGLMLYAPYGRRGVYETQAMLRSLTEGMDLPGAVEVAKKLLASLPPSHWLRRNPLLQDHKAGDAQLVDLLLHPIDRAFTVEEIGALLEGCGLTVATFIEPAIYDPGCFIKDKALLAPLEGSSPMARAAFAEKLIGCIKKHVFYVRGDSADSQPGEKPLAMGEGCARLEGPASIPVAPRQDGPAMAAAVEPDGGFTVTIGELQSRVMLPPLAPDLLRIIDGRRDLPALHKLLLQKHPGLPPRAVGETLAHMLKVLGPLNLLLIRHSDLG